MLVGHFPAGVFDDMRLSVKSGSLVIFSMRDHYWDDANEMGYKVKIDKMVQDKLLEPVKRHMFTKYEGMTGDNGFGVFQQQPCSVHIYKRLD